MNQGKFTEEERNAEIKKIDRYDKRQAEKQTQSSKLASFQKDISDFYRVKIQA